MAAETASTVRGASWRSRCLSLAKTCSMGLRSGEYLGRNRSRAPAWRMACRHGLGLVRAEVVHDDDVAGLEGWDQHVLHIDAEALAVDRPVDEPGRIDSVVA